MKVLQEIANMVYGVVASAAILTVGIVVALYYAGNIGILQFGKHLILVSISY